MLRIIFFAIIAYVLFKILGKLFFSKKKSHRFSQKQSPRVIDEMVQDPVCKVYLPKREAVGLNRSENTLFFCSRDCLEKFKTDPQRYR